MAAPFLAPSLMPRSTPALAAGVVRFANGSGGGFGGSAIALIQASKATETVKAIMKKHFHKKDLKLHDSLPLCQVKAQSYFRGADYKGVIESTYYPTDCA